MNIAIIGLGYVGLTAAACLSELGHRITGIDVNESKVAQINAGRCPIVEPGLPELLQKAVASGQFTCFTDVTGRLSSCAAVIVCVGTPSGKDGSHNMTFIAEATRQIAQAVDRDRKAPLTVIYRSTIRPGTIEQFILPIFEDVLGPGAPAIDIVYNPEFLRESVSIKDFFSPSRIVVGTKDGKPNVHMDEMNAPLDAPVFYTRYREAEITKFIDNSFHALKVAFANEVGRVCVKSGIEVAKVHEIFIADTKLNISPYYLRPGGAFGGSCLPKDVRALQHIADTVGAATPVVNALIQSNEAHKKFIFEKCISGVPAGGSVLMVGIAFKEGTDDLRESPNVDLANMLLQNGYELAIYDPALELTKLIGQNLGYIYERLPSLRKMLKDKDFIESARFDLVIDANGLAAQLDLKAQRTVQIHSL